MTTTELMNCLIVVLMAFSACGGRGSNAAWSQWASECEGHVAFESVTIRPEHAGEFCREAAHVGIEKGFDDPRDLNEDQMYEVFTDTYRKCDPGFFQSLLSSRPDYCESP